MKLLLTDGLACLCCPLMLITRLDFEYRQEEGILHKIDSPYLHDAKALQQSHNGLSVGDKPVQGTQVASTKYKGR